MARSNHLPPPTKNTTIHEISFHFLNISHFKILLVGGGGSYILWKEHIRHYIYEKQI